MKEKKPKLSLCMIVKNEEAFLAQCLESIRDAVNEMVVVDTGSEDRTVDIAKQYGAKVYFHPWRDSFSEARNESLRYVTGDWVLQLDADEELYREDIPLLLKTIASTTANAVFMPIYNELPEGGISKHYFPRLYRRGFARYVGIVHNQLVYQGEAIHAEIRILHHGYNMPAEKMEQKYQRSANLLRQQIADNPQDIFAWHNLIRIYRNQYKYDLVVEKATRVLAELPYRAGPESYLMIAYDAAVCAYKKGDYKEAERFCRMILEKKPDYVDALTVLASVQIQWENYVAAIETLQKALQELEKLSQGSGFTLLKIDSIGMEYRLLTHLGYCYIQLKNYRKGQEALLKSLQYKSDHVETYQVLGTLYMQRKEFEKARSNFERVVEMEPQHKGALANLAFVWLELGEVERTREILYNLSVEEHIKDDLLLLLGSLSVRAQDFKLAILFYEKYLRRNPHRMDIITNIANCYACQGHFESAIIGYREVLQQQPANQVVMNNLLSLHDYVQQKNRNDLAESLLFST